MRSRSEKSWLLPTIAALLAVGFLLTSFTSFFVSRATPPTEISSNELPLTSERHMRLARAAAQHLQTAADALENGQPLDLAAIDLHAALDCLGEVTGDRVDEKLLDSVFSRFCVGK